MKYKLAILFAVYLLLPAWYAMMPEQDWLLALFGSKVFAQTEQNENEREKVGFWDQLQAVLSKKQDQDNKPQSATEKYPLYYNWIHQKEQKFYDSLSQTPGFVTWDEYQGIITLDVKRSKDTSLQNKLTSDTLLVYTESYIESQHYKLGWSLLANRSIIGVAGIFLAVFIIGGLIVALFDWRVREIFFQNRTLRLIYSMAAIAVLLSIYTFYLYVTEKPLLDGNNLFALGVGLTLVVGTTRVVGYFFEKRTKNLP